MSRDGVCTKWVAVRSLVPNMWQIHLLTDEWKDISMQGVGKLKNVYEDMFAYALNVTVFDCV